VLLYQLSPGVVLAATALSLGAGALGAFSAVRRAVRIPPAEAMRPEPPARYRRSVLETPWLVRHLTTASRMVLRNIERQPVRAAASVTGIACAASILVVGFVFIDAMEELIETQFSVADRQDVTVAFVEPVSPGARHAVERLPGVLMAEPQRIVAARIRARYRHRNLAITGLPANPRLRRVVDRGGRVHALPEGLLMSRRLGEVLNVSPGDTVTVEVLEGTRPVRALPVAGLVDDTLGLSAYMEISALHRLMRESDVLSATTMLIDSSAEDALSARLKLLPAVAGVAFKRAVVQSFRDTLAQNMNLMIGFNVLFAGIIAFGVVYNAARVSLSERSRELASLRVLGFSRAEISLILLGELAVLTVAALPLGALLGHGLSAAIVASMDSEVYRFPLVVKPRAIAWAFLTVIAASVLSGLVVRRRLDHLDLVSVLKITE
jgi:putative ABC transport system permease protein